MPVWCEFVRGMKAIIRFDLFPPFLLRQTFDIARMGSSPSSKKLPLSFSLTLSISFSFPSLYHSFFLSLVSSFSLASPIYLSLSRSLFLYLSHTNTPILFISHKHSISLSLFIVGTSIYVIVLLSLPLSQEEAHAFFHLWAKNWFQFLRKSCSSRAWHRL